jgi:HK97 gp10 family phage protein
MEDLANDLVEEMWSRAPYDDGVLQGSIGWTWGDAPAGSLTIGTVGGREFGTMRITIFAGGGDAFYARFHEFGTVNMAAKPFFFPVYRARRRSVRSRITGAIRKAIRES